MSAGLTSTRQPTTTSGRLTTSRDAPNHACSTPALTDSPQPFPTRLGPPLRRQETTLKPTERDQADHLSSTPITFTTPQHVPLISAAGDVIAHATVDPGDHHELSQHAWHLHSDGYAFRRVGSGPAKTLEYMHRLVLNAPAGSLVDHVDGNRLNNTRSNLRLATPSQNNANSRDRPRRSGYRCVYWHRQAERWVSQISVNGRLRHLGLFDDPEEAAKAYDLAARATWGSFARANGFA